MQRQREYLVAYTPQPDTSPGLPRRAPAGLESVREVNQRLDSARGKMRLQLASRCFLRRTSSNVAAISSGSVDRCAGKPIPVSRRQCAPALGPALSASVARAGLRPISSSREFTGSR